MMAYNLYRTAKAGQFEPDTEAQAAALEAGPRGAWQISFPSDARRQADVLHRAGDGGGAGRRHGRNYPDVSDPGQRAHHRQRETVHATRGLGPRPLL